MSYRSALAIPIYRQVDSKSQPREKERRSFCMNVGVSFVEVECWMMSMDSSSGESIWARGGSVCDSISSACWEISIGSIGLSGEGAWSREVEFMGLFVLICCIISFGILGDRLEYGIYWICF